MRDPRLEKLADVLVSYSVGVKPNHLVRLTGPPVHPAIGVAVSIACSGKSLIFSMRILASVWVRD